jgi:pilus assembly protein CpaC
MSLSLLKTGALALGMLFSAGAFVPAVAEVVPMSGNHIAVETGKGVLLRLPDAATNIFVADPKIADIQVKSPRLVYVYGLNSGDTTLYALGDNDRMIYNAVVSVSHDMTKINAAIARMMPGTDVKIESIGETLVMTGHVASASQAEDLNRLAAALVNKDSIINRVEIASPNQVNLRVKVAEVSRSIVKQLGFNWQAINQGSKTLFGIATGNVTVPGTDPSSYFGNLHTGNLDLSGLIDAMETDGLVSVLAEPNLTAMSGQSASFLAGGQFPIPVPQSGNNNGTITVQYKNFGVSLAFTPTVLADDRINLKVSPEVSQLSSAGALQQQGFSIPSLTTRKAETTVELGSGQSFAIAGLLQNTLGRDLGKLPGLGDIPIIGALFRSDAFRRNETELVIIVTPYIVRPVNGPKMALPTDGLVMPNDYERLVKGEDYVPQPLSGKPAASDQSGLALVGPGGFVLN